jgi:hypothetical protein
MALFALHLTILATMKLDKDTVRRVVALGLHKFELTQKLSKRKTKDQKTNQTIKRRQKSTNHLPLPMWLTGKDGTSCTTCWLSLSTDQKNQSASQPHSTPSNAKSCMSSLQVSTLNMKAAGKINTATSKSPRVPF